MSETPKIIENLKTNENTEIPEEKENKQHSIEELKINKNNPVFKELQNILGNYFDKELGQEYSSNQKENIKLALMNNFNEEINKINLSEVSSNFNEKILALKDLILSGKKGELEKAKIEIFNMLKLIGAGKVWSTLQEKVKQIKDEDNKELYSSLEGSLEQMGATAINIEQIKKNHILTSSNFAKMAKTTEDLKEDLGENFQPILDFLTENFPMLGKFLSLILGIVSGKESIDNSEKTKKSNENLKKYFENSEKSIYDNIKEKGNFRDKEKLNPEKLKKFYKFLDTRGIDYTKDVFWEDFLSGKSTKPKIKEIYKLFDLNSSPDGKRQIPKEMTLDFLITTLNSIPEMETKGFNENLAKGKIEVNGKLEDIGIINEGKNIKIGEKTYKLSIKYMGERFQQIKENNGVYTIYAEGAEGIIMKVLEPTMIKDILKDLIIDDKVNKPIKAGKYNVNLKITKV